MRTKKSTKARSKFAPVRTKVQRESDLVEISKLALTGLTQFEITAELNRKRPYALTRSTIALDLAQLRKSWSEAASLDTAERFDEELAKLANIERKAWSKFDSLGEPAWMNVVLRVISQRVNMLGLSRPVAQTVQVTAQDGSPFEYAILDVPPRGVLDRNA